MTDVLIIGAGSAGLALAYQLKQVGIHPRIIDEASQVASSWRARHAQLSLNTHKSISNIPGLKLPKSYPTYPTRDQYVAYMEDYVKFLDLPVEWNTAAKSISQKSTGHWQVTTNTGTIECKHVVVCTGSDHVPYIPDWPGREKFKGELIHGGSFRHAADYRGKSVLLVGAGNSGVDIGNYLAKEHLAPSWFSIRNSNWIAPKFLLGPIQPVFSRLQFIPLSVIDVAIKWMSRLFYNDLPSLGLPEPTQGAGALFRKNFMVPSLDDGFVAALRRRDFVLVPEIKQLSEDSVEFINGDSVKPDAIICATGYRLGLKKLLGDLDLLDASGFPTFYADASSPYYPGLWFLGLNTSLYGNFYIRRQESARLAQKIKNALL